MLRSHTYTPQPDGGVMEHITLGTPEQRQQLAALINEGLHRPEVAEDPSTFLIHQSGGISCCALGMAALAKFGCEQNIRMYLNTENGYWPTIRPRLAEVMDLPIELFDEVDRLHHKERTPARIIIKSLLNTENAMEEITSPYRDPIEDRELVGV